MLASQAPKQARRGCRSRGASHEVSFTNVVAKPNPAAGADPAALTKDGRSAADMVGSLKKGKKLAAAEGKEAEPAASTITLEQRQRATAIKDEGNALFKSGALPEVPAP